MRQLSEQVSHNIENILLQKKEKKFTNNSRKNYILLNGDRNSAEMMEILTKKSSPLKNPLKCNTFSYYILYIWKIEPSLYFIDIDKLIPVERYTFKRIFIASWFYGTNQNFGRQKNNKVY